MPDPSRGGRGWNGHRGFRGGGPATDGFGGGGRAGGHQSTRGRGTTNHNDQRPCHSFQRTRYCRFGAKCNYSHDVAIGSNNNVLPSATREKPDDTPEQHKAKADYYSWKRLIKSPPRPNDVETIRLLWNGALDILEGEDREGRQMLPRDLDNGEYFGLQHMKTILTMQTHPRGHGTYVDLARPFLLVMSHPAILDCLTVDTSVGNLYNFISGSNGSRAVLFFQNLSNNLAEQHLESISDDSLIAMEKTLDATTITLRELLRREVRAAFNDDLPDLLSSLENVAQISLGNSVAAQRICKRVGEVRTMVARANRLLHEEEEPAVDGVSTTAATSTYPREIIL
jgi:hypothetical protein